jgi:hypothetical protein
MVTKFALYRKIIACVLLVAFSGFSLSCATMPGPDGKCSWSSPATCIAAHTAGGAVLGGLAGLAVGALADSKNAGRDALIGAAVGGVAAFAIAWGKCFACFSKVRSEPVRTYQDVKTETNYAPQQGTVLKINKGTVLVPATVAPGGTTELKGSYLVMFPPDKKEISVTETAILKAYNQEKKTYEEVGRSSDSIVAAAGERKATSEIPIPDDKRAVGKYLIEFMISTADGKSDSVELPLTVSEKGAKGNSSKASQAPAASEPNGNKSIADNGVVKYVVITAARTVVRETPSSTGKKVAAGKKNDRYPYIDSRAVGGKTWYQVTVGSDGKGWVSAASGNIVEK